MYQRPGGPDAHTLKHWLRFRDSNQRYLFYGVRQEQLCYLAAWCVMRTTLIRAGLEAKKYARLSDETRDKDYFRVMKLIEQGGRPDDLTESVMYYKKYLKRKNYATDKVLMPCS